MGRSASEQGAVLQQEVESHRKAAAALEEEVSAARPVTS